MIRLGLCCLFVEQPIKFSTTTATHLLKLPENERLQKLSRLCLANAEALKQAYEFCAQAGIGCFRINSQILPLKTHPQLVYQVEELPDGKNIVTVFKQCGDLLRQHALRASFHPDQFVVLNSPNPQTVASSLAEIEYQNEVAEWVGADVINIHAGGGYGDKPAALRRFTEAFKRLSPPARQRVTIENDDKTYAPSELLPLCHELAIPLVYDVHHHRCRPDGLSIEEATAAALKTWRREPMFHLSSPLDGWQGKQPYRHHDYIDTADFPGQWLQLDCDITIEVEAKAKELAVLQLKKFLASKTKSAAATKVLQKRANKRNPAEL
ncbi:MAG: UV DNA damage repair endonuclease UvsE [Candidatus Riflebacteria bacterium HGW-Riflebacteria-2]|jgi:UV DNA damage endonuclease|nr:MAG: UV DNA damage repair endonuclease UvsE [Candidatus Riflebacteria bacterium HGW-Riflebacteria-2]